VKNSRVPAAAALTLTPRAPRLLPQAVVALACLLLCAPPADAAWRQILSSGDMKVLVSEPGPWCRETAEVHVQAPSEEAFKGDRLALQRLTGQIRLVLEDECPAAVRMVVVGSVRDQRVFIGTAAKDQGWTLAAISAEQAATFLQSRPPAAKDRDQTSASAAAHPAPAAPAAEGTAHQTTSAPDYAQTNIPPKIAQNSALNKKACDFITKSDAESILGQPVEMNINNTSVCSFIETGSANKVKPIKQVHFYVRFNSSPDDYAVARKNISDHQEATEVVKEVPNFADAAIWRWIPPAWGQLTAFKGGTIRVVVSIRGIPEDSALQNAKALAAKPFGGTAGTGYVYAQPLPKTVAPAALPPRKALVAGSEPPLKNVALSVCNAGKVDIDVFVAAVDTRVTFPYKEHPLQIVRIYDVAKEGPIVSSHIVPSACARVYSQNVGVPAYVGLALVDSSGQWGTARRLDHLPDFGIGDGRQGERPDVLTFADKSVSFRRAEKEVAAQLQLFFRPRTPKCWNRYLVHRGPWVGGGSTTEEIREDLHRVPSSEAFDASCETLPYVLNVVAYPDSRDIEFTEAKKAGR
jgi:hypothetical protein